MILNKIKKHREAKKKAKKVAGVFPRRFTAMSKMIGVVAFLCLLVIIIYSLVEMHRTENFDHLGQLMISSFAFVTIYTGFYLNMAKAEHIAAEKAKLAKELEKLKKECGDIDPHQEYEDKKTEFDALKDKYIDIISREDNLG